MLPPPGKSRKNTQENSEEKEFVAFRRKIRNTDWMT